MAEHKEFGAEPGNRRRAIRSLPIDSPRAGTSRDQEEPIKIKVSLIDEPVDQEEAHEERQREATDERERLRDQARGFFGAKTKEKMSDRDRQREADLGRSEDDSDEKSERDHLLTMRAETRLAGDRYMQSLRDSNLLVPGFNEDEPGESGERLDAMHHVYMQMMMQSCLKPLAHGVNPQSIIQAAGMMVTLRMLSPDFKREMGNYLEPLKEKVQARIDNKTRGRVSNEQAVIEDRQSLFGNVEDPEARDKLVGSTDPRDHLSRKWRKRYDDLQYRERGHREMYTPQSAAMTEVALMENAFWKMREPNADVGEIHNSFKAMRQRLRRQSLDDGLDRQDVVKRARVIIGERMESEPELRTMFNGVAHGRIVKGPPHDEQIAGSDRVHTVWSGEFDDQLGQHLPEEGMLTLRRPMDADEHQVQLSETMRTSMLDGFERGDQESYSGSIYGYLTGFAAQKQGTDTRGLPTVLQHRIDQSEAMLASMEIDGLSAEEQQRVYSNAFTDALEGVVERHPDFGQRLRASFGNDWQSTLQTAVDDPQAFFDSQKRQPQGATWDSDPATEQETGHEHSAAGQTEPDADDYQPA